MDAPIDVLLLVVHTRQLVLLANLLQALNKTLQQGTIEMLLLVNMQQIPGTESLCQVISKTLFKRLLELLDVFSDDVVQTAMTTSGQAGISLEELKALGSQTGHTPPPSIQVIRSTLDTAVSLGETFSQSVLVMVDDSDTFLSSLLQQLEAVDRAGGDPRFSTLQMAQLAGHILQMDRFIQSQLNPRFFSRPGGQQTMGEVFSGAHPPPPSSEN